MTNEQLLDVLGFVSISRVYDINTFVPIVRFTKKDGTYEDLKTISMVQLYNNDLDIINDFLLNKFYLLCKNRNDKIDEILNS